MIAQGGKKDFNFINKFLNVVRAENVIKASLDNWISSMKGEAFQIWVSNSKDITHIKFVYDFQKLSNRFFL